MARSIACISAVFSLWIITPGAAVGQAAVEYAHGAGRAGTTAAPARGIGETIRGLAASFDKITGQSSEAKPIVTTTVVRTRNAPRAARLASTTARPSAAATRLSARGTITTLGGTPAARPAVTHWEDPKGIATGLSYGDLVRRFGPPAMEITGDGARSLTYPGPSGGYQIELRGEKVASIVKPQF